jgi:hypothetical protein
MRKMLCLLKHLLNVASPEPLGELKDVASPEPLGDLLVSESDDPWH